MKEIVFDTETTGFDPTDGHRIIEIGCIELENHIPTGRTYHQYINPERDIPQEAVAVHGLTAEFLSDKPVFGEILSEFMDFLGDDAKLVAHNAVFDVRFINEEVKKFGFPPIDNKRVIDTLHIAREKFPGSPANLDALCRRFGIDNAARDFHGALLDSELLAEVYLELLGGRQHGMALGQENVKKNDENFHLEKQRLFREPRIFDISPKEQEAHLALLNELTDPIWKEIKA